MRGNGEIERTSLPRGGLHPYFPMMQFNNFLAMRQADARALVFCAGMQPLENDKDALIVGLVNPDSIICKRKNPLIIF